MRSKQQEKLREKLIQSLVDNKDFEGELGEYVDTAIISLLADSGCGFKGRMPVYEDDGTTSYVPKFIPIVKQEEAEDEH